MVKYNIPMYRYIYLLFGVRIAVPVGCVVAASLPPPLPLLIIENTTLASLDQHTRHQITSTPPDRPSYHP